MSFTDHSKAILWLRFFLPCPCQCFCSLVVSRTPLGQFRESRNWSSCVCGRCVSLGSWMIDHSGKELSINVYNTVDSRYLKVSADPNYWYLKVNFLVPENYFEVLVVEPFTESAEFNLRSFLRHQNRHQVHNSIGSSYSVHRQLLFDLHRDCRCPHHQKRVSHNE